MLPDTSESSHPIKRPIIVPVTVNLKTVRTFFTSKVLPPRLNFRCCCAGLKASIGSFVWLKTCSSSNNPHCRVPHVSFCETWVLTPREIWTSRRHAPTC